MMHKILEHNGDQYFQYMTSRGYKLPPGYDVRQIVQQRVPTELEVLQEEPVSYTHLTLPTTPYV